MIVLGFQRTAGIFALCVCVLGAMGVAAPVKMSPKADRAHDKSHGLTPRLDPNEFRCIVVGDSQTTGPDTNRIRTQTHRWDAPMLGELLIVGNSAGGFLVNNGTGGSSSISYQLLDVNSGWGDGGPNDFFAIKAHQWIIHEDIDAPESRIGRFRLRFDVGNTQAPWDDAWGIGAPLRARIVVRTSPRSVPAIEVRAERGGQTSATARGVYELSDGWGLQVLEHFIPADFAALGDDVGVGIYLPDGYIEEPGSRLQILGVFIERVDSVGRAMPGTMIAYQGRGGWTMDDHLGFLTTASRVALIQASDADHVLILLGHNQEPGGLSSIEGNLAALVTAWEFAYQVAGRPRPRFVYVCPWTIIFETPSAYLLEVERVMGEMASRNRSDVFVNYLPLHDYTRPDIYDPSRYMLDGPSVHPGDVPTAVNLAEDLYEMLFEGRRD